jgi:hypothetical protein
MDSFRPDDIRRQLLLFDLVPSGNYEKKDTVIVSFVALVCAPITKSGFFQNMPPNVLESVLLFWT